MTDAPRSPLSGGVSLGLLPVVVLVLGLLAVVPSPAVAGLPPSREAAAEPSAAPEVRIRSYLRFRGRDRVFLVGSLDPPEGPVVVQRATRCDRRTGTCDYRFYRRRTLDDGRFRVEIDAPPTRRGWVWRVRVRSSVGRSFVTCTPPRPEQECRVPYGREE